MTENIFEGFTKDEIFMYKRFVKQIIRFKNLYENLTLNAVIYRRIYSDNHRFLVMFEDKTKKLKTCLCVAVKCWWLFITHTMDTIELNDDLKDDIINITEKLVCNQVL